MWRIQANIVHRVDGWHRSTAAPTFYLASSVHGIMDEAHAIRVARNILASSLPPQMFGNVVITPTSPQYKLPEFHITAVRVCDEPDLF